VSHYLFGFCVYTTAMIGLICIALFVFKKAIGGVNGVKKSDFLDIEESISLAPRKNLYVIKAGNEKFLIASDSERTSLISKLDYNSDVSGKKIENNTAKDFSDFAKQKDRKQKSKMMDKVVPHIMPNTKPSEEVQKFSSQKVSKFEDDKVVDFEMMVDLGRQNEEKESLMREISKKLNA